jgi:hypothetical protein
MPRNLAPSTVFVLTAASLRSPRRTFLSTLNFTSTRGPSSSIEATSPTRSPDTCTAAPDRKPPASVKYAEYCVLELRKGSLSYCNAAATTPAVTTTPKIPMMTRLRSAKGFIGVRTDP